MNQMEHKIQTLILLLKIACLDEYKYSWYGIGFGSHTQFSFKNKGMGKNVIIFGADIRSSVHADNKGKDILIVGKGPAQGLDDTTLKAEAEYRINFTQSNRKTVLSLHYNGGNSFLFVNAKKIYQFKANDSEIKKISLVYRKYFEKFYSY